MRISPLARLVSVFWLGCALGPPTGNAGRDALQLEPADLATDVTGGPVRVTLVSSGDSFDAG